MQYISEKNCFGTFVHTALSRRRMEGTFVLDRAYAQRVYNADKNICALSTQPIRSFHLIAVQDCNKN